MDSLDPTGLLGGLTPRAFLSTVWQRRPLLVRQAWPGVNPPLNRAGLFELAARDDVESRLVQRRGDAWRLRQGPFSRRQLPALSQPGWTLLVQGLDLHVPAAHALMARFRFASDARLDDVMVSYASDGGGVGPHQDSYDVFLLQVQGRRRWRVGPVKDATLLPDRPVKLLAHFEPTEDWLLEPGDMLYVPPGWGHDGTAEGACMTCSIGFRAPDQAGLLRELLPLVAEMASDALAARGGARYRDPARAAPLPPARVPPSMQRFAQQAVARALRNPSWVASALGEALTEPKARVWFEAGLPHRETAGVALDRRTRMLYDERCIYINGDAHRASGRDAVLMHRLADQRALRSADVRRLSAGAGTMLADWIEQGWLHDVDD